MHNANLNTSQKNTEYVADPHQNRYYKKTNAHINAFFLCVFVLFNGFFGVLYDSAKYQVF